MSSTLFWGHRCNAIDLSEGQPFSKLEIVLNYVKALVKVSFLVKLQSLKLCPLFRCDHVSAVLHCYRVVESYSMETAIRPTMSILWLRSVFNSSASTWPVALNAWAIQSLIQTLLKCCQQLCFHHSLRKHIPGIHSSKSLRQNLKSTSYNFNYISLGKYFPQSALSLSLLIFYTSVLTSSTQGKKDVAFLVSLCNWNALSQATSWWIISA